MTNEQVGVGNSYSENICPFRETHLSEELSICLPGGRQTHMIQFQTGVVQACWNPPLSGLETSFFFFAALLRSGRESQKGGYKIFYPTAGSLHPGSSGKDQKMWICLCRQFPIKAGTLGICPKSIYMSIPLLWITLHNPAWDQLGVTALSLWSCKSRN